MRDVLVGDYATPRWTFWRNDTVRVVNWNIDRGLRLDGVIGFLEVQRPDILVLQEVDLNARRTGFRNVAEEIARALHMNYALGFEFEELTQGRNGAPAFHGQATLSHGRILAPRVIRFRYQSNFWAPRWFVPRTERLQRRLGGRIALVTEVEVSGRRLLIYNLHLESRGDDRLRLAQLGEAVEDARNFVDKRPVLLAGDLNLDVRRSGSARSIERVGFHSAIALPPPHTTTARGLFRHQRTIDWVYLAGGIEPARAAVYDNIYASDHFPIVFDLKFSN